jgi:hypothetical protein
MQKLLLFLIYAVTNFIILQSSNTNFNSENEINNKKNEKTIISQCKEIIENLKKTPEIMTNKEQESLQKYQAAMPTGWGGSKDIYLYEHAVFTSLAEEAKTISKQITSENIQDYECNPTILTHLQAIESCFEYNPNAPKAVNYAYRGIDQITYIVAKKTNIMAELFQLKSQLKFQRLYQELKNDTKKLDQYINDKITMKEETISNRIEHAYSEKIDEIKKYIGITNSDGVSIKEYIINESEKATNFINAKEKKIEQTTIKCIFSLSRISLCIILGIFANSAYKRIIDLYNNRTKKKTYRHFFDFFNKNIVSIIDFGLLIGSTLYCANTPKYLDRLWQK